MKIAILHPQCRIQWWAIKMALLSTHLLTEAGHDTALYTFSHSSDCFADLQKNIKIELHEPAKNISFSPLKKLISIITLAWRLRHVDTIIANNPPMQITAALAKVFNQKIHTLWWHHHTPWYIYNNRIKSFFERYLIMPFIDTMIVTSHFVGDQLNTYSGRDATVIHPVLDKIPQQSNKSIISENDSRVLLFTHGRLEPGKGIETVISVWKSLEADEETQWKSKLIIYGTGSLEPSLKAQWIDVQLYKIESTLTDIANSGVSSLAIYASTIDAFGMAPLEAQSTGISTLILDRGGARETLVSDVSGECVGRLVDTESDLCATVRYFITHKKFPENMSIVNFSHTIDYFRPQRLSSDLLSVINKTKE